MYCYNLDQAPCSLPVHLINNQTALYFRKYLLQKALSIYKWQIPETWDKNYFLYSLYIWGYVTVFDTPAYGPIPQHCTLKGYNIYYRPTEVLVSNPVLGPIERRIGIDCEVIRMQPDYGSIMDLIDYYAGKMAMAAEAVDLNFLNSHLSYVFAAENKATAESFKKMFDKIASGEPAVVIDSKLFGPNGEKKWELFSQNLKQNYLATDLLSDLRKIEAMFDTDVGIPNANTDKRERLITDEVNANNVETAIRGELWLEELRSCVEKVNRMFGLNITVDWRMDPNGSYIND